MSPSVSSEQLIVAVNDGDVPTIAAFFTQRGPFSVANAVAALGSREGHEWLVPLRRLQHNADPTSWIATVAIMTHNADVIAWLFSDQAIATIDSEWLTTALRHSCTVPRLTTSLPLLDLMLTSPVFGELLAHEQQQYLLDRLLFLMSSDSSVNMIRLLTAHGANINNSEGPLQTVLQRAAATKIPAMVETVIQEGALVIGLRVTWYIDDEPVLRLLLDSSVRWDLESALSRHAFHARVNILRAYLERGFADVEVHDEYGRTPLMAAAWLKKSRYKPELGDPTATTRLLLEYGADVTATDSIEILGVVLQHGADPNRPGVYRVFDHFPFNRMHDAVVAKKLELLLQYGANALLPGRYGLSAVDQLRITDAGTAFLRAQYKLIPRVNICDV